MFGKQWAWTTALSDGWLTIKRIYGRLVVTRRTKKHVSFTKKLPNCCKSIWWFVTNWSGFVHKKFGPTLGRLVHTEMGLLPFTGCTCQSLMFGPVSDLQPISAIFSHVLRLLLNVPRSNYDWSQDHKLSSSLHQNYVFVYGHARQQNWIDKQIFPYD